MFGMRDRIFGAKKIHEIEEKVEHIHEDVEHVLRSHPGDEELSSHLKEIDEHLHELIADSKSLEAGVPLGLLAAGDEGVVLGYCGGRGVARRLLELGFTPSSRVKVISGSPGLLVDVKGSRIALGRGIAMKILVDLDGR
ncbi:FeoA domain protein [Candidatus Methanoperedenaceae archaeon GB50]|nr:MAG: FeoA domain protein [Candidatus Methanoperedenaceae archaeon GB50]CAD7776586.1 FeoA domain protein [Candidatus Methanoperedenaceae archaeon GB50]